MPVLRYLGFTLAFAAGCLIATTLDLVLAAAPPNVPMPSLAPGFALAALAFAGLQYVPGVALGILGAHFLHGTPLATAGALALGITAAASAGAWFVSTRRGLEPDFRRVRDVLWLVLVALGAPVIAGMFGVMSPAGAGLFEAGGMMHNVGLWAGDALGVILFAPLILAWLRDRRLDARLGRGLGYAVVVGATFAAVIWYVDPEGGVQPVAALLLFPLALWPALRLPMREIATFNIALAALLIGTAWFGFGPFGAQPASLYDFFGMALLGCTAVAALLVGARSAERRDAQVWLQHTTKRFDSIERLSAEWYWEQDEALRFTRASLALESAMSLAPAAILGRRLWELPFEDRNGPGWADHRRAVEAREPFRDFLAVRRGADGMLRYGLWSGEPIVDGAGQFRGYRGVGRDITTERATAAQLAELQALVARVFGSSPNPMVICRLADDRVIDANAAWLSFFGRSRDEFVGRKLADADLFSDPAERSHLGTLLEHEGAVRNAAVTVRTRANDAAVVLYSAEIVELKGERCAVVTLSDLTERDQLQTELRRSRERLERMFGGSPLPMALSAIGSGAVLDVNDAWSKTYGYARAEIVGYTFLDAGIWVDPDARRRLHEALRTDGVVRDFECRWRRKSGEVAELLLCADAIDLDGEEVMLSTALDITVRKQAESRLRESEARLAKIFQSSPLPVVISRLEDGCILELNDAWARWIGYPRADSIGKLLRELAIWAHPRDGEELAQMLRTGVPVRNMECQLRKRSGELADTLISAEVTELAGSRCCVTSVIDITELKQAERQLRESEGRFRDFAEAAGEYVWEVDVELRYTFLSRRVEQVLGYAPDELLGRRPFEFMPAGEYERVREWFTQTARARKPFRNFEHRSITRFGSQVWQLVSGVPIVDADDRFIGYRGTALDISERKQSETRIAELATRDPLTGLPNRLLLSDRLGRSIAGAQRDGTMLALIFIDLDHFKRVNDTLGHETGDVLLREVAKRIGGVLRKGDTLARLGGDEFVVLLEGLKAADDAAQVARKIIDELSRPCDIDGHSLSTAGSIGIAIYPNDGADATTLMRHADTAMYVAKSSGRKNYQFFSAEMNVRAAERLRLEAALRGAADRGELRVYYQPRVDVASDTLTGAEALLRWQQPDRGLLTAGRFLPLVEETGLIHSIGEWALATACDQAQAWHSLHGTTFAVAVNISPKQLNRALVARVRAALNSSGLDPRMLELELTESALSRGPEEARTVLAGLRGLGVRAVVDEFGTGLSSMSQLRRFAIDGIKIDRSFVRGLTTNADDRIVVKAMIDMARALRINTIAQGVETQAELELLRSMGCEEYSGHLLAEAGAASEFERRWLRPGNVLALRPRR
jgi:diguanylate cyclase (GGDEF)-like protein/PAS domain S-box-containing protein